jgi:hypothetical protein
MLCIVDEKGRSCPQVFCDYCQERILTAREGNYQFLMGFKSGERAEIFFTHKRCCHAFEQTHPAPAGFFWGAMELKCLPIYLGNTLQLEWKKAKATAKLMATAFA